MLLAVLGANGRTGQQVIQQALDKGHQVNAIARNPAKVKGKHSNLKILYCDIWDVEDLSRKLRGCDVVISCLGASCSLLEIQMYSQAARAIVSAMDEVGIRRLVVISSWAVFNHEERPWYMRMLSRTLMKSTYEDMLRMEGYLLEECAHIDFTCVRPPALTNANMDGRHLLVESGLDYSTHMGKLMPRADLARCLLNIAEEGLFVRECVLVGLYS